MPSRTDIKVLGPCRITVGGNDVGFLGEDTVLEVEVEDIEGKVGEFGGTPLEIWHLGQKAILKGTLRQVTYATYVALCQAWSLATDGSNSAILAGQTAGAQLTAQEVILTPLQSAVATTGKLTIYRGVPRGPRALNWKPEVQSLDIEIHALIDPDRTEGDRLFRFGHASVAADTSAPTATLSPLDDATGVSKTAAKTITWNEAMDYGSIIKPGNIQIYLATDVGVQTPVPITVTHNTTTHVTSVTPVSALGGTTEYSWIISEAVKNASGVAYAGSKTSFTTAA